MLSRPVTRLLIGNIARRSFTSQARNNSRQQYQWSRSRWNFGSATTNRVVAAAALSGGIAFVLHASTTPSDNKLATPSKVDYNEVRKSIAALLDDNNYDDGSYGPLFVRLGWHASGTYSHIDSSGGSNGGCMRFQPESEWGANKGLHLARERLESVYRAHPGLTYADLYTLAAVVAIEEMGGPKIKWRPGRNDHKDGKKSPADGRLPDAAQGAQHIRDIFYRMGFNDQETVALIGAHSMGRCHTDRSGYDGPWTFAPTTFSNEFFRLLLEEKWQVRRWKGPKQYEDVKTKTLMMLPADMALVEDPEFRKYVVQYAKDGDKFSKDFAAAFEKLLELGVDFKTTDGSRQGKNVSLWSRIFG
ncbi:unnamed protein product [Rotaria sp. Silwood1]|nr:unnamed protein product [Rotaria sp. Silwood1]CAF1420832.1 unnamed protein product [Rotaria sp. Silwood1]CAF3634601.1 unnamed protein product [Rotaria sp. Silwood1]CAF3717787.1 unnamed protein product [Rotaria sp. Silwood1]CAF4983274.1 unnamed protein product [Rotaria sp. Silwood1]